MEITFVRDDEYTKKAENLYSILNIFGSDFKSIDQLTSEYIEQNDSLKKEIYTNLYGFMK